MKKMTISEFGRFLSCEVPEHVILCSENQQDNNEPASFSLTFQSIRVSLCPNSVNLRGSSGFVCLNKTKHVLVDKDISVLGTVVHVICENFTFPAKEICYTLILQ